jgi:hypothetical protein
MSLIITLTIAGTVVLIGIIAYLIKSKIKKEAWEGEVVDKREETSTAGEYDSTYYNIYVKTTEGLQKKVTLGKKVWDQFAIGDKLLKVKGEAVPRKV